MELAERLRADGTAKGLCHDYQTKLSACTSVSELVGLFIKGIDFCINQDFPTLDFMRERFKGKCEPYGAFVDDHVEETDLTHAVLNGACTAGLRYDGYKVARVYVRHTSLCAVGVSGHAIVTIDAFDQSHVHVAVAGSNAKVFVNVYGKAKVECEGDGITVINKNKNTY